MQLFQLKTMLTKRKWIKHFFLLQLLAISGYFSLQYKYFSSTGLSMPNQLHRYAKTVDGTIDETCPHYINGSIIYHLC
jgi:hypothetical protein